MDRKKLRAKRKKRIRAKISGTTKVPRLCVFRSLKNVYVQVIDDQKAVVLVSANMEEIGKKYANTIESAKKVGKIIAKKCLDKKIKQVLFDRGGYKYHGKVKALAEGAREGGLSF